jgi:hypothetical protein
MEKAREKTLSTNSCAVSRKDLELRKTSISLVGMLLDIY